MVSILYTILGAVHVFSSAGSLQQSLYNYLSKSNFGISLCFSPDGRQLAVGADGSGNNNLPGRYMV